MWWVFIGIVDLLISFLISISLFFLWFGFIDLIGHFVNLLFFENKTCGSSNSIGVSFIDESLVDIE